MFVTKAQPLDFRVLNLARGVAGAYTTRLLADLGANCSRLCWTAERPGDWPQSSAFHTYFDRGIEVVEQRQSLNLLLERLPALAAGFDLIVADFPATEIAGEGSLYERLRPYNPGIIAANVDHFGRSGPYAHWTGDELTDYALGGYWALAGEPEREPLRVPGYQAQFHAGLQLAIASLAAVRHSRLTGAGQEVDVSAIEAMLGAHWSTTIAWTHEGRILKRNGSDLFAAQDGWVFFYTYGLYRNLFLLIERPELMDDPRWATIAGWLANSETIWTMVRAWCHDRPVDEIVRAAQELRIPVTPMATAAGLLEDPQLVERQYFQRQDGVTYPGRPYRWSDPWQAEAPQPLLARALGTETPPVLAALAPITRGIGGTGGAPLAGLHIIEVTNNWAGPIAGRHLADLGAEVIKVELASKPATRASHYPGKDPGRYHWNRSGYFNEMNRNKRDVALNLATKRGRELFLELVLWADVLVENNSARVLPNLGLGYASLSATNPRIVMASISGFGASGPSRDWVAYGSNIEAACGLAAMTGYDESRPYRTGSFVPDPIAGGHATVGILAALERRDRTGLGAHLDISLTESAIPFMTESLTYFQEHGTLFPRRGNSDPDFAPTGAYRCAGSDNWLALAVRTEEQWQALCCISGMDGSAYPTTASRVAARAVIDTQLGAWAREQDQYECARSLQAVGVPAAPILHNWQLHMDPHLYARGAFLAIEHPDTGVLPYPGFPWRFSTTKPAIRTAAPRFAEANDYVFGKLLGLDRAKIEALYAEGVTAREPEGLTAVVV